MKSSIVSRLEKLEAAARGREPVQPALVVVPAPEGGYTACGKHFETAEAALEAYPDMQPRVVVRVTDSRRPQA